MFDIGMGELGLLAIVGLLVLGPERLPRVARTTGVLLRKARQSWASVRADIERELAADELKRTMQQTAASADPMPELRRALEPMHTGAASTPTDAAAPAPDPAPPADDTRHEH